MPRGYAYVGPREIAERATSSPPGTVVASADEITAWARSAKRFGSRITATFVVDEAGRLLLADRHSEHVACAGGMPVLAAGEITFAFRPEGVHVEDVSNQSTGYCPEPESWHAVAAALDASGLDVPDGYTMRLSFRRCTCCGQINVVKDQIYECAVCSSALPPDWNLDAGGSH